MNPELQQFEAEIGSLRLGGIRGRKSPHKLLLLLAILDRVDAGEIKDNRVYYDPGLTERFRLYFDAVAQENDWCQPGPPFFHLRSSKFWHHQVIPGREDAYASLTTSGGGNKRILDNIQYAFFGDDAWAVIADPEQRSRLRHFIVETFFSPEEQTRLWQVISSQDTIAQYEKIMERGADYTAVIDDAARSAAFGRLIRRIYDYQCAMCGLRIITPDGSSPIDAAHLIPWSETHDDSPTNGMALCKLHHWALDANLIAPTINLRWAVSPLLDPRRNSECELTRFHKSPILLPRQKEYYPRGEAILWRYKSLAK
jgi:putative restriction endonuclease